jgi:hypothetical protein
MKKKKAKAMVFFGLLMGGFFLKRKIGVLRIFFFVGFC